jgi:hypothetical protein
MENPTRKRDFPGYLAEGSSVLYCLSLDDPHPGFDASFESSVFARASDDIEAITKQLKIKSVFELFSYAAQNSLCPPGYEEKVVPWFDAQVGIDWLGTVIGHIRSDPSSIKRSVELLADLTDCESILRKAREIGAKWHFEMDI